MNTKKNSKSGFTKAAALICKSLVDGFVASKIVLPERFTLTAHTGCEGTKDNSLDSIVVAFVSGADIVEFDLFFDENGVPVLSHDEPKGSEPTLEDAFKMLSVYKKLGINIDIKRTDDLSRVVCLAEKYELKDRIFFTGVVDEFVEAVKQGAPEISYFLNKDIDFLRKNDDDYINELIAEVISCGARGLNIRYTNCTAKLVEKCHENNLEVSVWTVNNKFDMKKVLMLGVDNVTTRKPKAYNEIISSVRGV